MTAYIVTIETRIRVELDQLDDATRQDLYDNYEPALLPANYMSADYLDGSITYEPEPDATDPQCESCDAPLGNRHEHYYEKPLCDDCLFSGMTTKEEN